MSGNKSEDLKNARVGVLLKLESHTFIRFKGAALVSAPGTSGFTPLEADWFALKCYEVFNYGISKSTIAELQHAVEMVSPDWTEYAKYVAFDEQVWDMEQLKVVNQRKYVYQTATSLQPAGSDGYKAARAFVVQLSKGDEALATDYLQAIAPLFMHVRPDGIIWFVGDGANGKSSLLDALYRLFGRYFKQLTTADFEDGKMTPMLRGVLGNIVKESSEARILDDERYKAIGTHESFTVRRFNYQTDITVDGNFHTIFNANNIPVFSDKSHGARRRTLVLPFPAHFESDPNFNNRTFTAAFLGGLMSLVLEQTLIIRDNNHAYKWSEQTVLAKSSYDADVNSAEAYLAHLREKQIVGFVNYKRLAFSYEDWCGAEGLIPLGVTNLKKVMRNQAGAERRFRRVDDIATNNYYFADYDMEGKANWFENGYCVLVPPKVVAAEQLELKKGRVDDW